MTKKDYELIAQVINELPGDPVEMAAHRAVAEAFADALAATNPRFNRVRFLRACGVDA